MHAQGATIARHVRTPGAFWSVDLDIQVSTKNFF